MCGATLDEHHETLKSAVEHCLNCKAEQKLLKAHLEKHPSSALHTTKAQVDDNVQAAKDALKVAKSSYSKTFRETPGAERTHRSTERVIEGVKRGKGRARSEIRTAIANDPAAKTK